MAKLLPELYGKRLREPTTVSKNAPHIKIGDFELRGDEYKMVLINHEDGESVNVSVQALEAAFSKLWKSLYED